MRARLARALRAIADRLASQPEADALRLDVRRLEQDLAVQRKLTAGANAAAERAYAERDRAWADAAGWQGTVDGLNGALLSQGAAARRLLSPEVARPVFGRRDRPAHLRPVD